MWNPFRRRKKNEQAYYYEAACAMVGVNPRRVNDFVDAWVENHDGIAVVIVETWTRPTYYLTSNPLVVGTYSYATYWLTQLIPHPSDQAETKDILAQYTT